MSRRLLADVVVPGGPDGTVLLDAGIDIDDLGLVSAVGGHADLTDPVDEVVQVGGLLMPGLVNTHAHTPMTLVRSAGDGLPLAEWLSEAVWPREGRMTAEDAWWGMTLGAAEMLLSGVTTTSEMYLHETQVVDAIDHAGMRGLVAAGIIAALSPDGDLSGRLGAINDFIDGHDSRGGRIHMAYGPHSAYDLSGRQLAEIAEAAQQRQAVVHIHLEETEAERRQILDEHGITATRFLADHGVLEAKVLAAHGVWLDADDRRLLAQAGAAVTHCPQSNLKLGSGIAPLVELLEAGVRVGLGTDGPASNDDLDLWEELKLAPMLARGTNHDPAAVSAVTALDLATRSGALALGFDDVGVLRAGAQADVIRIDLDHPAFAPGRAEELLANLVWAGSGRHVTDVWVAGRQVVQDRQCLTVDVDRAVAEVKIRGARLARS